MSHDEVANTNIEAVFDLILDTAIENHMSQDDIPQNILIISDMEFDGCAVSNSYCRGYRRANRGVDSRLFQIISQRYEDAGYKLPSFGVLECKQQNGCNPRHRKRLGRCPGQWIQHQHREDGDERPDRSSRVLAGDLEYRALCAY